MKIQAMFQCGCHYATGKLYFVFLLLFVPVIRFDCVASTDATGKPLDSEVQSDGSNDPTEVFRQRSSSEGRKDISLEHNDQPVVLPGKQTKLSKRLRGDSEAVVPANSTEDIPTSQEISSGDSNDDDRNDIHTRITMVASVEDEQLDDHLVPPTTESDSAIADIEYVAESETAWNPTRSRLTSTTRSSSTSGRPSVNTSRWLSASSTEESSVGLDEPSEVLYTVSSTTDTSRISETSPTSVDDSAVDGGDTTASSLATEVASPSVASNSSSSDIQGFKPDDPLEDTGGTTSAWNARSNDSDIDPLSSNELDVVSTNIMDRNTGDQFPVTSAVLSEWTVDLISSSTDSNSWFEPSSTSTMQMSSAILFSSSSSLQLVTSAIYEVRSAIASQISFVPSLSSAHSVVYHKSMQSSKSEISLMSPSLSISNASMSQSASSVVASLAAAGHSVPERQQYSNEVQHELPITTTKHSVEDGPAAMFGAIGPVEPTKAKDKQEEEEENVAEEEESNDAGDHNIQDDDDVPLKEPEPREGTKSEDGSPKEESEPKIIAVVANDTVELHSSVIESTSVNNGTLVLHSVGLFGSLASSIPMLLSSTVSDGTRSPILEFVTPSYINSTSENRQYAGIENVTTTVHPAGFYETFVPIAPTKATSMVDRRTKYNRLPTERNTDEKENHDVTESNFKPDVILPTIRVPVAYLSITMKCSWSYFCLQRFEFQRVFAQQLKSAVKMNIEASQVVFFNVHICKHVAFARNVSAAETMNAVITVPSYVSDEWGVYSKSLTELLGVLIIRNRHRGLGGANVTVANVVLAVQLHRKEESMTYTQTKGNLDGEMGIIALVTISCIAVICLVLLFILLYVLKRRHELKETTRRCRPIGDAYSLDSVSSIHSSFRRRKIRASKRSYLNHGFDDPNAATNKLNFTGLANACLDDEALAEEYKKIPMQMARYEELPAGAEVKNRYANIIPFPETRVVLTSKNEESGSDYINANYVRGYRGEQKRYIACQAPLANTVTDFWQMVWENQCKVIVMLTAIEEDGMNKCAPYFSETDTLDCHRLYGDYQVTTKKKDVRESYTVTALQLKNLERNLMRDIVHFWYSCWPTQHVPFDRNSVAELLVETRPYTKSNSGPIVVHCSPGTGRTGTVIAIDICMQEFAFSRTVDVPQCVHRLRQDRGGCVQTSEQYIFIYEVLGEYASRLMNHSGRSSVRSTK